MPKGLIFLCCAACILLLTIINLSIGPIINRKLDTRNISINLVTGRNFQIGANNWGTYNCKYLSDEYDDYKKDNSPDKTEKKYTWEWPINECKRKKAMHDMEYTAFIFDIVIGFVCCLLGLLHFFEIKKEYVLQTGLIGLGCGAVGFVLTFVYVIFNGIVYTSYYDDERIFKLNGDRAFAELDGNKYKCLYFDEKGNDYALLAKYSDLIKKQYNYNKKLDDSFDSDEVSRCISSPGNCVTDGYIQGKKYYDNAGTKECKYLYHNHKPTGISNKDKSDRFLTTLILSLLVCLANIGLALFGFLLFKTPNEF